MDFAAATRTARWEADKALMIVVILGACNPPLAHQALTADDKIGTMLPCNVIVQDIGGGKIEVAAIDPAISIEHVGNLTLNKIAKSVTDNLRVLLRQSNCAYWIC